MLLGILGLLGLLELVGTVRLLQMNMQCIHDTIKVHIHKQREVEVKEMGVKYLVVCERCD